MMDNETMDTVMTDDEEMNRATSGGETPSVTSDKMSEVPIESAEFGSSLPSAEEVRTDTRTGRHKEGGKGTMCLIVLTLCILGLILGLAVGLAPRGSSSSGAAATVPRATTVNETMAYLIDQNAVTAAALSPGSPQYKAAAWMANEDGMNLKLPGSGGADGGASVEGSADDPYRYLQRYVMAVVYYALGGSEWAFKYNFMSPHDACAWQGLFFAGTSFYKAGVQCDPETGYITQLYLGTWSCHAPVYRLFVYLCLPARVCVFCPYHCCSFSHLTLLSHALSSGRPEQCARKASC